MSRFWSPIVNQLTPYVPGEQPKINNLIKLNTNENPYGPSPKALAAMQAQCTDSLRLYPDPNASDLKACIAQYFKLDSSQVFVGNGSDEVLAHVFQGLLQHDKPLLSPDISYSFYPVYAELYGIELQQLPLAQDFTIAVEDYQIDNGGIIFPNPNAPTGIAIGLDSIETVLKANPNSVVVVDEAYVDFGADSAISLIPHYDNLLVVQTLSKSRSLAGIRLGYALGSAELIEGLERVKNSFNSYPIDRIGMAGAIASFGDEAYFNDCCEKIIVSRNSLAEELEALDFSVLPSRANFLFVSHNMQDAQIISQKLREQGIIVRHFKQARIDAYLRITIGTDAECKQLIEALRQILAS